MGFSRIRMTTGWAWLYGEVDGHWELIDPEQLPASPELRAEIAAWGERFDPEFGAGQVTGEIDPERWLAHRRAGWVLARRLAREIGSHPVVHWEFGPPALDAPTPH